MASILKLAAASAALVALSLSPAAAKCTKLAFSVNDYGKDGPTKDAKDLLDKYIAKWAAERGIKKYTTGKKDVTCELFLDFGVFDEHTCKAAATVCWTDGPAAPVVKAEAPAKAPDAPKKAPEAAKKPAPTVVKAPVPAKTKE